MELTFYGARGSYPIARRDQIRYGGNTTCLHFRTRSGQELILDGGSGIRLLGQEMLQREFAEGRGKVYILVGHTHWDHILGFPFFDPFHEHGNHFVVVSAGQPGAHIRDILSGQQSDINFPVSLEFLPARLEYLPFKPGDELTLGEFRVETAQLNHPWQREYQSQHSLNLVYASDEWYLLAGLEVPPADEYDGFPKLENGVGLTRVFLDEWEEVRSRVRGSTLNLVGCRRNAASNSRPRMPSPLGKARG